MADETHQINEMSVKIGTVEIDCLSAEIIYQLNVIDIELEAAYDEKIWNECVEMIATEQTVTFPVVSFGDEKTDEWTCQCYVRTLKYNEDRQTMMLSSEVLQSNLPIIQDVNCDVNGELECKYLDINKAEEKTEVDEPKPFLDWNKIL